jgi:NitT/TauT family transport system substrate-binding protein
MQIIQNRRIFLAGMSAAGAAGLFKVQPSIAATTGPPPEVSKIRLAKIPGVCIAPQYVAEELLHAEGFDEIEYVESEPGNATTLNTASGNIDFSLNFITSSIVAIDEGKGLTLLSGVHSGCFELFVRPGINSLRDLRGKRIGVQALGSSPYLFLASMAAYVGIDPLRDINWVSDPQVRAKELYANGEVDAFLGFPPEPQELRARGIGRVLINSTLDQPWAGYFCCLLAGNADFVREHPVTSKRVLRAILKAADLCAEQPDVAARRLVERNFTANYDYALEALTDVPYRKWREYDSEDTVRFYSLRLQEAGMIKSTPQTIIANGTDWRFLNELRRELKT